MRLAARASPASSYDRLRDGLFTETSLDRLVALFADAAAEDGIDGHYCVSPGASLDMTPLFGDAPHLLGRPAAPGSTIELPGDIDAPARLMLVSRSRVRECKDGPRLRGFATLYAARATILLEAERDVATNCPLTLQQRTIFARLLTGERAIDIAGAIGISVAAVRVHIERAIEQVGAADARDVAALAARRGWLVAIPDEFNLLSTGNTGY